MNTRTSPTLPRLVILAWLAFLLLALASTSTEKRLPSAPALELPPWSLEPLPVAPVRLPPSWREVLAVPAGDPPEGLTLSVSPRVGLAPLRIAVRFRVVLEPGDRSLHLSATEQESELTTHSSETFLHEQQTDSRTAHAHWELSPGSYAVVGCVKPRRACVGRVVVVRG